MEISGPDRVSLTHELSYIYDYAFHKVQKLDLLVRICFAKTISTLGQRLIGEIAAHILSRS
jgi:hypothetical protein